MKLSRILGLVGLLFAVACSRGSASPTLVPTLITPDRKSPTLIPTLITPDRKVVVPKIPDATPLPLEPWKDHAWPQARVHQVAAVWIQPILQVILQGDMPTPCHKLHALLYPKAPPGVVDIRLVVEPPPEGQVCIQTIQPFKVVLNIQPSTPPVRVLVNGKPARILR